MAVVAAILAVVIALIVPGLPTTVRVSYRLPPGVRSLDVDYESEGALARSARFRWSADTSPEVLRHEPELAPGRYVIEVTIEGEVTGARHLRRSVEIDGERVTHVDLRASR